MTSYRVRDAEAPEGMRWCSGACQTYRPLETFWQYPEGTPHRAGARFRRCTSCMTALRLARREPGDQRIDVVAARTGTTRAEQSRRHLGWKLMHKYGITLEDYERRLEAQDGLCAVCGRNPDPGRRLDVDHCHRTGKVRGLLCPACNRALGQLGDDLERVRQLATYLAQSAA